MNVLQTSVVSMGAASLLVGNTMYYTSANTNSIFAYNLSHEH